MAFRVVKLSQKRQEQCGIRLEFHPMEKETVHPRKNSVKSQQNPVKPNQNGFKSIQMKKRQ